MPKTVADVLALVPQVQMVDFRFTDLPGVWQHFTVPAHKLDASLFEEGIGFDGSSIRGFKEIHESDMLLMLDPTTAFIDPIYQVPTLVIICDVYEPITYEPYSRDPRYIARRAETYLKQTGIADASYFGPEAEFFIFSDVRYGSETNCGLLPHRQRRGVVEQRPRPGQQLWRADSAQAGLFPDAPHRHLAGRTQQDRVGYRSRRHPG